jgi:hypothetical protein
LAPDAQQTRDLLQSGAHCIAYETVTSATGGLPLLTPMSEVAGRLAPQVGAHCLERPARSASRRSLLGEAGWRMRRPACRRARCSSCGGRHFGRRRRGNACRDDRARHGRECHRGGP